MKERGEVCSNFLVNACRGPRPLPTRQRSPRTGLTNRPSSCHPCEARPCSSAVPSACPEHRQLAVSHGQQPRLQADLTWGIGVDHVEELPGRAFQARGRHAPAVPLPEGETMVDSSDPTGRALELLAPEEGLVGGGLLCWR